MLEILLQFSIMLLSLLAFLIIENNYDVHFSHDGCCMQHQVFGAVIVEGLKIARLFPLHIPIPKILLLL